jgi:hypothetical protein
MSDEIGIMQHAIGSRPDPEHGYCTDDVSRALQVDLLHQRELGWSAVAGSAWRNLRFLTDAFVERTGQFRNFRLVGGAWIDAPGSEDCQGRALHALGDAIATAGDPALVEAAASLFERALPLADRLSALRATASVVLGCEAALRGDERDPVAATMRRLAERLLAAFQPAMDDVWPWPEPILTYENGLGVRALIVAGTRQHDPRLLQTGLRVLDWLVTVPTAPAGHLSPVGNRWWIRDGARSRFDQQPIEATSLLLAAEAARAGTGDQRWIGVMEQSYAWFLGRNDLAIPVADPGRGASYDGLMPGGVNANQGAESTLMWLTALEHVRAARRDDEQDVAAPAAVLVAIA